MRRRSAIQSVEVKVVLQIMELRRLSLFESARRSLREARERLGAERNIMFLFIDTTIQGILAGGLLAFMPIFIVRLGGSSLLVSLLTALPALGIVLFSIPAAQYVARRQDMVRITVINRLSYHTLFLLIALIPFFLERGLAPVLVILWSLQAIPSAISNVSWTEVIARSIPMNRLAQVNGLRWAVYSVVSAVSVALFGFLLERIRMPLNYQIVFLISVAAGYLSTYFFGRIRIEEPSRSLVLRQKLTLGKRLRALGTPLTESVPFRQYSMATFLIRLGMSLPAALYSIYWVNRLLATDHMIGLRTTAGQLALVAGYAYWGRSVGRVGYRQALIMCGIGISVYPALTALVGAPALLIPVALVWGFFSSGIDITVFEGLLRISPPENRTAYVGMNTVIANLAVFMGPILGSLLSGLIGIELAFFVAGAVGVCGAVLTRIWGIGAPQPQPVTTGGE